MKFVPLRLCVIPILIKNTRAKTLRRKKVKKDNELVLIIDRQEIKRRHDP